MDENIEPKGPNASRGTLFFEILSHQMVGIEGVNVEELGEFCAPVHLVMGGLPVGKIWRRSGYAWLYLATVSCLLQPIPHPHRRCPSRTLLFPSMISFDRQRYVIEHGHVISPDEKFSKQIHWALERRLMDAF